MPWTAFMAALSYALGFPARIPAPAYPSPGRSRLPVKIDGARLTLVTLAHEPHAPTTPRVTYTLFR